MATLHLQHGEVLTDDAINLSVPLPGGIYEVGTPVVSGTGPWTVTVPVGPSGYTLWRDAGTAVHGRQDVYESGSLTFTVPAALAADTLAGNSRIDLLYGAHHWAASSPLGTMTAEMAPYYNEIQGVGSGGLTGTPSAPAVPSVLPVGWAAPAPGGAPVVLFQVLIPPTGTPTVSVWPATDNRITNFGLLYNEVVTARSGAANLSARLAQVIQLVAPSGTISMFAGATAPTGYLLCNGAQVSQTTYPALYALLGSNYGAIGLGTFTLPNLIANFPMGANMGSGLSAPVGSTGGEATHILAAGEVPPHTHTMPVSAAQYSAGGNNGLLTGTTGVANPTGAAAAHNNMPPYVAVSFIIKT